MPRDWRPPPSGTHRFRSARSGRTSDRAPSRRGTSDCAGREDSLLLRSAPNHRLRCRRWPGPAAPRDRCPARKPGSARTEPDPGGPDGSQPPRRTRTPLPRPAWPCHGPRHSNTGAGHPARNASHWRRPKGCWWLKQHPSGTAHPAPVLSQTGPRGAGARQTLRLSIPLRGRREHTVARSEPASPPSRYRDPDPSKAMAAAPRERKRASDLNFRCLNLFQVVDSQSESRCVLDVSRLTDEAVDAWIVVVAMARLYIGRGAVPDGDGVFGFALVVDHVEQQAVDGDWIGAEHHLLRIKAEFAIGRKWAAVPYAAQPIHDLKHGARPQRLDAGQSPNERISVGFGSGVGARHVGETSVGDIFETPGHTGGSVILHVRHVDDFGELFRDWPGQVGARVVLPEEIHLRVGVRIVTADCSARVFSRPDVHSGGDVAVI